MSMTAKGLVKLIEETGELQQIIGKKLAYFHTDDHPDEQGSLKTRIENEIADVMAICTFVIGSLNLSNEDITKRLDEKLTQYKNWDKEP